MSENKIAYTSRTYDDCRREIIKMTRQYYPEIFDRMDDASIGNWLIEMVSDVYDALNFHIDRTYQETMLGSAQQKESLLNIARTNGLKIPGKKAALCEIEISCVVPIDPESGDLRAFDKRYCPIIQRGSLFSSGTETFELMDDVYFADQFNKDGMSDRIIEPMRNSNGVIQSYRLKKLAVVQAGQSKVYKKVLTSTDIKPFAEFIIQDNKILGVESIIVKKGTNFNSDPLTCEYFVDEENYKDKTGVSVSRFFEVDNLIDQYRFGYEVEKTVSSDKYYNPVWEDITEIFETEDGEYMNVPVSRCVKGQWKRLKNKFVTEFDSNNNIKVIFGAGLKNEYGDIPNNSEQFTQYMMSRMEANDYMGVLPEAGSTMYILYRVGGGAMTNIAAGTLTNIIQNNFTIEGNCNDSNDANKKNSVRSSFAVRNTTPSYGGKDEPTEDEIKWMIKYNNASQNRCVTLHDYKIRLNQLPAKYGCPFRMSVVEENNKVIVYALGLNSEGKLKKELAEQVAKNIIEYLSNYKMMNDFVEMRSGKIINVKFELTVYVDKTYEKSEVTKRIINNVYDYMDIRKHEMGEDIFLGDLTKTISQLDGVINLVKLKCYNPTKSNDGGDYSNDEIAQELIYPLNCPEYEEGGENVDRQIDLDSSDMMLFSESNSMYEIKDKNTDITVIVKTR